MVAQDVYTIPMDRGGICLIDIPNKGSILIPI